MQEESAQICGNSSVSDVEVQTSNQNKNGKLSARLLLFPLALSLTLLEFEMG